MTERSAPGASRARRGHQNHPRNVGNRTSNIATSEIIQALKEGRNLETLFVQPQQLAATSEPPQDTMSRLSGLAESPTCDETRRESTSNTISSSSSQLSKAKRNSSSSSLASTPSEKSEKQQQQQQLKKAKNSDAKRKKRTKTADIHRMERPAAEGAEQEQAVIEDDDEETAEWSKLRCTSERTEVIAERENRRQKKCADYPGLAFARSIFSSDSMMKFNIIRNELQNIMNNQLRRVRDCFANERK